MNINLSAFNKDNLFNAATNLFQQLNIKLNSSTAEPLPAKDLLKHHYKDNNTFKAIVKTYFIGIIDDSVFAAMGNADDKYSYKEAIEQSDKNYNGLMLFALELNQNPTRTQISELTRAFNRISQKMPVALLLKYTVNQEALISIAISERFKYLQAWRQGEKAGKVIMLRDVHTQNTHAGHIRILKDLQNHQAKNFNELHQHWLQVLDVSILNKKFYEELSNWYFTAINEVSFPDDLEKDKEIRNATNLIRLITRIIFIWFIKEKGLVPKELFDSGYLSKILKHFNQKNSYNYYNAILQNLFFATLNQKREQRAFAEEGDFNTNRKEYDVKVLYRYSDLFSISKEEVVKLFSSVPFLNGGLFDCLDREKNYVDGFSRNPKKRTKIHDDLFFNASRGLFNILNRYKFTVVENTPIEEEIALDPELLGKVFENLLASYNPETQTTARKATGSFYTPREVVDYMVDESLLGYLKQNVKNNSQDFENRLRDVFSYSENPNPFNEAETKDLIEAINNCKILDPACGSGAFPMGILHKMVHILQKLDPGNVKWKAQQKEKIIGNQIKELEKNKKAIEGLSDKAVREKAIRAVDERLKEIDEIFESKNNFDDYARKLYLIENCIYGIDIQPIAVQISKLRFFISLIIDQDKDPNKENLGFRSLPNLETKFVAANTLMGLEKPQQLSIRNPKIDEKEEQLKHLRHEYFTASTRDKKKQLQKKDEQLRKEIAELLQNDGWNTKTAQQIAAFDPYDQNLTADWFDPEWMFGVNDGFDIVIGNPPYIQLQKDGGRLAKLYEKQNFQTFARTGDIYALFYEKGMQLLKHKGILAYITSNKWMRAGYGEKLRQFFTQHQPLLLIDLGPGVFENATVDTNILLIQKQKPSDNFQLKALTLHKEDRESIAGAVEQKATILQKLTADAWFIGSNSEQQLKEKIERLGKPLKDWDVNIYRGVLTGLNEAFIITTEKRNEILANCKDEEERKRTEAIIKPILRGRDIKRYYYEWAELWVIVIPAGWTKKVNPSSLMDYKKAEQFITQQFPALMQYLKPFEEKAKKRDDQGDYWWELRKCAYYPEFEKEKIVYPNMTKFLPFVFDNHGFYTNQKCFILVSDLTPLKFLTGYFNSKIAGKWIRDNCPELQGGTRELSYIFFQNIPIPPITPANEPIVQQIENLVDKILSTKKENPQGDTSAWERKIDELVYRLYELNENEIKIIEGGKKL